MKTMTLDDFKAIEAEVEANSRQISIDCNMSNAEARTPKDPCPLTSSFEKWLRHHPGKTYEDYLNRY